MIDGMDKPKRGGKREGSGRKKIELVQFKDLPTKQIILEQVLYWINLQATAQEIAGSFYVSVDTLYRRLKEDYGFDFAELHNRVEGGGKLSLRKHQFDLSIWLGKIWLGQTDKDEIREIAADVVREAIRELKADGGIPAFSKQALAAQQPVLDQGQPGKQDQVQTELGAEGALGRSSSLQDSSESSPAGNNDVFVPDFIR